MTFNPAINLDASGTPQSIQPRHYFDNAATSWPKSPAVVDAVAQYMTDCGAAAGRGGYRSAQNAATILAAVREQLARLIGLDGSSSVGNVGSSSMGNDDSGGMISFHASGTHALNVGMHGLLRSGDRVVTTAAEHNSVLRPLKRMQMEMDLELTVVPTDQTGLVNASDLLAAVDSKTRLVVMTTASNVTGAIQPVAAIAEELRERDTLFMVDAAQTLGAIPIDVSVGIDALAAPLHKCVGGPPGTAMLYLSRDLHSDFRPLIVGGTGSQSESWSIPNRHPECLESGNLNVAAIAGLKVALDEADQDQAAYEHVAERLFQELLPLGLDAVIPSQPRVPVFSFVPNNGLSCNEVMAILDSSFGIEVRSGYHCAAAIHPYIGTEATGTVRISASPRTSAESFNVLGNALREIFA